MINIIADSISLYGKRITTIEFKYDIKEFPFIIDILATTTHGSISSDEELRILLDESKPEVLQLGDWHLPYITPLDLILINMRWGEEASLVARKISSVRCHRISRAMEGHTPNLTEDLLLYENLGDPTAKTHQATPDGTEDGNGKVWSNPGLHGDFVGWIQNSKLLEMKG